MDYAMELIKNLVQTNIRSHGGFSVIGTSKGENVYAALQLARQIENGQSWKEASPTSASLPWKSLIIFPSYRL